jgi:hypothetical protein
VRIIMSTPASVNRGYSELGLVADNPT